MKKMLNKKFFLILGSTILVLIVLSIGMIFLTKENVKTFNKEGYIIASGNEEASIKYYFDEGTNYKTNISSQLVFTDSSGEKVTVDTDNFMHYIDGGIKFLKNGVIMDLDNIDSSTVPYYNITNKSVLEYTKKSYFIETIDKTLAFNNIAGRISENKYIFAGIDINLQLAGNDNIIEGDYFEITFIEDGIIKVENQEVSYQTTAQNSLILVDDNIKIDLGNKKIYFNDEEKMSLSQMTIDGNENIEIIPDEEDKNDDNDDGTGKEDGTGEDNTTGNEENQGNDNEPGTGEDGTQPGEEDKGNQGEGDGTGDGSGTGENNKRKASIDMLRAQVGVNNISASFIVNDPDNTIKGDLVLHITNTDTGKRVYSTVVDKTQAEVNIGVSTLSPDSNYILSINEETDEEYDTQYFQKLFKTESLGISLEKKYVTQDSLAYEVIFEKDTQVNTAKITLYDENYKPIRDSITVSKDNNIAYFEELTSNTSYNIELDDVIMESMEYNQVYSIKKSTKTLKKTPYLEGLTTSVDDEENTFTIGVERILDEHESITKYSYYIYEADSITQENIDNLDPVKIITKTDKGKVNIGIDNEKILPKTNYRFKVVAEYYDNEKYGEFETELSDNFILSGKPKIDFVIDNEKTSINKIVGTLVLNDDSCTVPMYGRACSSVKFHMNNFKLEYKIINSTEKNTKTIEINPNTLEAPIEIDNLIANTEYVFNLYGNVDLLDGKGLREGYLIGTFRASTDSVDILNVEWQQNESSVNDMINLSAKITVSGEDKSLADSIYNMTFNLYAGNIANELKAGAKYDPLATKSISGNLKEEYYDKFFKINTRDTFGIVEKEITIDVEVEEGEEPKVETITLNPVEVLKSMTNDNLLTNYTIEITGICDEGCQNQIPIEDNYYNFVTPPLFRMEYELEIPTITADPITNVALKDNKELVEALGVKNSRQLNETTIVGYKLNANASIDRMVSYLPVKELIYYVCDERKINCDIETAVMTKSIDLSQTIDFETYIPVEKGTVFSTSDNEVLARGHNYVFKLKFHIDTDNDGVADSYYPNSDVKTATMSTPKQTPSYKTYILNTDEDTVNYKIEYYDIDNALYEEIIYYTIDDELKNTINKTEPEENPTEEENPEESETTEDETPEEPPVEEEPKELEVKSIDFTNCKTVTNDANVKGKLCDFSIDSLSVDSVYEINFKRALIKRSSNVEEVKIGEFIFDGKFAYDSNTITFSNITYENDNVLRIKINEDSLNKNYVNRISAYHVVLSAEGVEDYERVYASDKISTCTEGETTYKCIEVDYANIKEFKAKNITVKVSAYYDSGIIDNIFATNNNDMSSSLVNQYGYILQTNNKFNKEFKRAKYIHLRDNGSVTTTEYPTGIYTYGKTTSTSLNLIRKLDLTNNIFAEEPSDYDVVLFYLNDGIYLKDSGSNNQSINNKLLSNVELGTTNNKFKFNSIIPKINVISTGLVNGARITIKLNGVDEEILKNEFKAEDGKYYYYLDIYKDEEKTEVYKTAKVEISLENTGSVIELTGYLPDTTYYYEVSAYLLKDKEYKKTLLFDARNASRYVASTYSFSSLAPTGIYSKNNYPKASYIPNANTDNSTSTQYLKRELTLEMTPNKNIGEYQTRFEIYDINGNLVLTETVSLETVQGITKAKVVKDITPTESEMNSNGATGIVFGSDYYTLKAYIITDVYEDEEHPDGKAELIIYESPITLTKLADPTYSVQRIKKSGQSNYGTNDLYFKVTVNDPNRVIKDGKYCAVLLDYLGQPISGISPKCGLSALEVNKEFSYTNLKSNTVYTFKVYADVYTNNIDIEPENKNREVYENTTVTTNTNYNVALGKVTPYISSSKITLSFDSGINVGNIKKVFYTLYEQPCSTGTCGSVYKSSQTFVMNDTTLSTEELGDGSEIYKPFSTNGGTVELVISPSGLSLTKGYLYSVGVKYYIYENGQYVLIAEDSYNTKY